MSRRLSSLTLGTLLVALIGCSKPDEVRRLESPTPGIFHTVETWYGRGAMVSDYTRVYAHLEQDGKAAKVLVLSGEYLKVAAIDWASPNENTIHLDTGLTVQFSNVVTLSVGNVSKTIHSHLQEPAETLPGP